MIVQFDNYKEAGGTLVIEDDGHGMTEETIRNTWMRLSTGDKENNPLSPQFDRKRAGKKGIGRFAVEERLGKQLILETLVKEKLPVFVSCLIGTRCTNMEKR